MKKHRWIIGSLAAAALIFGSCQKSDLNDLQEAQNCLNKAAASEARACVDKIAGDNSPAANSLKCSAIFISEGFGTAASFVDAFESISSGGCPGGGTCSSTVNALAAFNFVSAGVANSTERDANNATAAEAFNVCSQSNVKFYTQISSLFQIGTLTSMLAYATSGGAAISEADIKNELQNLPPDTVGTIVLTTYNSACTDTENASDATKKYCTELETALNGETDPTAIGACLKKKLIDPNDTCP